MKKILIIMALIVLVSVNCKTFAFADTQSDLLDSVTNAVNELDLSQVQRESKGLVGDVYQKILQIINGEYDDVTTVSQLFAQLLFGQLVELLPQLITLFCILVVIGLARKTDDGLLSGSTSSVIDFVGCVAVVSCVIYLITGVYTKVSELLRNISAFSEVSAPIVLTLLVANGGTAVSSICRPSMIMFSSIVVKVVSEVVLPLSMASLSFSVANSLSTNINVDKLSSLFSNVAGWILGVLFMLFTSFTTVQGISAGHVDTISFRATKYAVKNYVPILGGYVSDGFDMVVASTSLIKNSFGLVCMFVVLMMAFAPLVYTICANIGIQTVCAVTQPIVEDKTTKLLTGFSKALNFLSALVIAVIFMFCIVMLIAISCANGV